MLKYLVFVKVRTSNSYKKNSDTVFLICLQSTVQLARNIVPITFSIFLTEKQTKILST